MSGLIDGKYELLGKLGAGAMGEVHEARHATTARRVAIKLISSELAKDDAVVARFQREARAAGTIESRHIAQVFDAGRDPTSGSPYLVMELLEGKDLQHVLEELGPLRPSLAARLVAQALAGLEKAHASNVVHRDVKPANLYVARVDGPHRVVKIVDFGIAKVKDDLASSRDHALTQTATILGSPLYMSPEQARQSRTVDARADLWSMGIVLFHLLTGRPPHAHAETLTELLLAICTEQTRSVQVDAPWVPTELARVVDRALLLDPALRYATAAEMLADLATFVPDWRELDDAMLAPMSDDERANVAPRTGSIPDVGSTAGPAASATLAATLEGAPPALSASSGSTPGLAASQSMAGTKPTEPPKKSSARLLVLGAVALGGLGVVGISMTVKPGAHEATTAPAGLVATPSEVASVAPPPSVASSAPAPVLAPLASAEPTKPAASLATPRPAPSIAAPKPSASVAAPKPPPAAPSPAPKPPPTSSSPISRDFN